MHKMNNEYKMDWRRTMENHPTEANRKSDEKKKTELDWTHIMQRNKRNRENSIRMEFTGIYKKR